MLLVFVSSATEKNNKNKEIAAFEGCARRRAQELSRVIMGNYWNVDVYFVDSSEGLAKHYMRSVACVWEKSPLRRDGRGLMGEHQQSPTA